MKRRDLVMFAALCLLTGSEWLLQPVAGCVRGVVYLVVGLAAVVANGRKRWCGMGSIARLALIAVLVLSVPEAMAGWASGYVSGTLWTAALAVVPAMVLFVVAQGNDGLEGGGVQRLLVPALVGLSGILLLIPVDLPRSPMGWFGLAGMSLSAVLVAIAAVSIHRALQECSLPQGVAIVCLANSLVLVGAGLLGGWRRTGFESGDWVTGLMSAVEVVLLVALFRGMEPVRMTARFFATPLLTILEGYILLRPEFTARMGTGLALLAGGAGMLLLLRRSDEGTALLLR